MSKKIHYRCPICHHKLEASEHQLQDDNQHSFDVSKEGYVNLLLAQKMKSKKPGDSKEMLRSRRLFLRREHYLPMAQRVAEVAASTTHNHTDFLDIGCGEGYYLRRVQKAVAESGGNIGLWGLDISKAGVAMAAKALREAHFVVASAYDLPFFDHSFDQALSVFSPLDFGECKRVLKDEGSLITVGPGPDHLKEIAEIIYEKRIEHEGPGLNPSGFFTATHTERLTYQIDLRGHEEIASLVQMTPYYWQMGQETADKVDKIDKITITADFLLNVLRPTSE